MGSFGPVLGTEGGAGGSSFGGPSDQVRDYTGNANLQSTYQQLQGVSNGTGPNPAMQQYNQNIQGIAKQQAGAISSVQGISPALAARMISQQGSGAMQNAAAQSATMQAQQQLGAMGMMGNIAGQQASIAAGMQQNVNNVNAGLANQMGERGQSAAGGGAQGAGAVMGMMAGGGMVQRMAGGGDVQQGGDAPVSQFAQFLTQGVRSPDAVAVSNFTVPTYTAPSMSLPSGGKSASKGRENRGQGPTTEAAAQQNSNIPYAQPTYNAGMAQGGLARGGGPVAARGPGQRAKVAGNSYANDKIPAVLSEGEIVIPRAITQRPDAPAAAMKFVQAVLARKRR